MQGDFNDSLSAQWCELYVRFVIRDQQRLAQTVNNCDRNKLQQFLFAEPDIATVLAATVTTNDDYLTVYACLRDFDEKFWQKPHPYLLNGVVEHTFNDARYILTRSNESPIIKAITPKDRFKLDDELGVNGTLRFHHHWLEIERSTELEVRRSEVFDIFRMLPENQGGIKIGLSPLAGCDDMIWRHDQNDLRGNGEIPFWCEDASNEQELAERLDSVLTEARQLQMDVLVFPELIMTEALQLLVMDWLAEHNAFEPIIRLVVAGTRHVHQSNGHNAYTNRCTVLNHVGGIEWEQEKRQPFRLTAEEAQQFFGIQYQAFEPTQLSQRLVLRRTALGSIASPICLDFLCDQLWKKLPVDVFFVPAMSPNLARFKDICKMRGVDQGSAAFICNAKPSDPDQSALAYRPAKRQLTIKQQNPFLFTVEVNLDMN